MEVLSKSVSCGHHLDTLHLSHSSFLLYPRKKNFYMFIWNPVFLWLLLLWTVRLILILPVLSCFSYVWLFVTRWTYSLPGSSVHGILQARILEWVAVPSSRGFPWPRDETHVTYVSCTGRQVLYHLRSPILVVPPDYNHLHTLKSYCLRI